MSASTTLNAPSARHEQLVENGIAHQQAGQFREAEHCYQLVLRENGQHPDALHYMGLLAVEADNGQAALDYLGKAVALQPKNAIYQNNLGNAFTYARRPAEGLVHLKKAIRLDKTYVDAYCNLGRAYRDLDMADKAQGQFERCLKAAPGNPRALTSIAELALERGDLAAAQSGFEEVLKHDPENLLALTGLAGSRRCEPGDPLIKLMRRYLDDPDLDREQRAALHHALGKAYNDIADYDEALYHYKRGKEFVDARFHIDLHRTTYSIQKQVFTTQFFAERAGVGSPDERPVFIVGMPRSGTTLTEQILSSHPQVHGMGELGAARKLMGELDYGTPQPERFAKAVAAMDKPAAARKAEAYLEVYDRAPRDALRIVDKNPHNFECLGLIALMFPNARIIHCRRDAMDTCVSCYMHNFSATHGYNTDLATLGHYYRAYDDLMAHWRDMLPLPMLELQYEEVVADQEGKSRELIEFLGLEWDDACLEFFAADRLVSTPSRWQVRQPIYATSVKRWKRYEEHLDPLKEALGDLFTSD